ncbi:glucose 1-dehydrogenase [Marinovum sp. 2_MG-2023]|nr:glucose 1-dehydrogenase [Marinovum sp. 1_MG-2023]
MTNETPIPRKGEAKVVLITGSSRGIGAATAITAAAKGYDVAINYAGNKAAADSVAQQVRDHGQNAIVVRGDVAREEDVLAMFQAIDAEFGRLDALVNNAGVVDLVSKVEDMTAERMRRVFDVNILGAFMCAREAVKRMAVSKGGQGGSIVNLSSVAARLGGPNTQVDYAASKAAVEVLNKGLAHEVGGDGIRVNAIRPGMIETDIHASLGNPDRIKGLLHTVPMGRFGTASEVADAIVWLMSDEASYVNDAILDVSGGR